jgi:hypothetical protein
MSPEMATPKQMEDTEESSVKVDAEEAPTKQHAQDVPATKKASLCMPTSLPLFSPPKK